MEKVLIIIPDNNKGKFISKGYSSAFKELKYFVIEKKIYDLNIEEIKKINPNIIFIFWSGITQKEIISRFFESYDSSDTVFIHVSETDNDIPKIYNKKPRNYLCSLKSSKKDLKYVPSVLIKDYKTRFNGYKYTLTFAGNPATDIREKILSYLIYNYGNLNIFCRSYDFYKSVDEIKEKQLLDYEYLDIYRKSYRGYVESAKDLSEIYSSSKINIDLISTNNKKINYRCFEILASGGFLISPYNDEIIKYFDLGMDFETYTNCEELTDKIDFYLKNLNLASLIADRGRKNVINNYSYYDRLKKILKVIYGKNIGNR